MQVKKFEARTMQEALEMVKSELGPEAIILSARDNQKRFGLVGEGSVEITAAISDETLKMKQFTESRMRAEEKTKLQKAPARQQREVIEKFVNRHIENRNHQLSLSAKANQPLQKATAPVRQPTSRRYIDIADEEQNQIQNISLGGEIRSVFKGKPTVAPMQTSEVPVKETYSEIQNLQSEIHELKKIIETFKTIPQTFASKYAGADFGLPYELSFMFEKLQKDGVQDDYIADMLSDAKNAIEPAMLKKKTSVETFVARHFLTNVKVKEIKNDSKVHVFLGGHGQGKTTTLIKMAAQLVLQEKKRVAILTADTVKVGAAEQLKIYAQILNIPFASIKRSEDWGQVEAQLDRFDAVLVDFPGFNLKNDDEIDFLRKHMPSAALRPNVHLVIAATNKDETAYEFGRRYDQFNYTDVIFTALDEAVKHGLIYNFQRRFGKPLHSFGVGPRVPEDLEVATRERVLDLIFKLTSFRSSQDRENT